MIPRAGRRRPSTATGSSRPPRGHPGRALRRDDARSPAAAGGGQTARTQHAAIALGAIAMVGCAAIACATIWRASDRMPETAAVTIGIAALNRLRLFAVTAGAAALFMMSTLDRQRNAFAELRGREGQLSEQSALLQSPTRSAVHPLALRSQVRDRNCSNPRRDLSLGRDPTGEIARCDRASYRDACPTESAVERV